jgi:hypothetical protein
MGTVARAIGRRLGRGALPVARTIHRTFCGRVAIGGRRGGEGLPLRPSPGLGRPLLSCPFVKLRGTMKRPADGPSASRWNPCAGSEAGLKTTVDQTLTRAGYRRTAVFVSELALSAGGRRFDDRPHEGVERSPYRPRPPILRMDAYCDVPPTDDGLDGAVHLFNDLASRVCKSSARGSRKISRLFADLAHPALDQTAPQPPPAQDSVCRC